MTAIVSPVNVRSCCIDFAPISTIFLLVFGTDFAYFVYSVFFVCFVYVCGGGGAFICFIVFFLVCLCD
jgi:hypothetical protein